MAAHADASLCAVPHARLREWTEQLGLGELNETCNQRVLRSLEKAQLPSRTSPFFSETGLDPSLLLRGVVLIPRICDRWPSV